MDKIYHIYFRGSCKYHSLSEEEFKVIWGHIKNITSITQIDEDDFNYEELIVNKEVILSSSH
jgi:hypothetical protein